MMTADLSRKLVSHLAGSIPGERVAIRPMERKDAARVAGWVAAGRELGVFRPGPAPTVNSLLQYQRSVSLKNGSYECQIIEHSGHPIGYVDYTWRGKIGEVIGVFLEPECRNRNIGRYLLRFAVAVLRDRGCHNVRTEVYQSNGSSAAMATHAGFAVKRTIVRKEDCEPVLVFERSISSFRKLSAPQRGYKQLQGKNLYYHHVVLAETFADYIRSLKGVEMILGMGSLARGFGDQWSDLDIAVLAKGPVVDLFWRGEHWFMGVSVDLYVVDIDACPATGWDDSRKQAFEESVVLFEKSPLVTRNLKSHIRLSSEERSASATALLFKLGWLGFAPRDWYMKERYGYLWSLPPDVWMQRGSLMSAHLTLDQVTDMFLSLLFLANNRRVPDLKWRRFLSPELPFRPSAFERKLKLIEMSLRDKRGFNARKRALLDLVEETVEKLEMDGVLRGNLYGKFLKDFPDYDPRQ